MIYDGFQPAELAARLRAPSCLTLLKVTSTLDIIHELAAEGAPAGTLVLADEQVQGRGRQGRRWHSPPGVGIWLGYLMRPREVPDAGVLSLRVGLALVKSLRELGAEAQLKWPNDVLVNSRKVAGVLCEARWMEERVAWVAVGVGINVKGPVPEQIRSRAISLDQGLPQITRVAVLESLVPRLQALSDDSELSQAERDEFGRYDWLCGRRVVEPVVGRARGVALDGALLVETARGVERVVGGHVVAAQA